FVVEPKRVVLSAGAMGSPAILLRSGYTGDGLVGRRTFLHPVVAQMGVYTQPVAGFSGAPQSVASHHFAHRGAEVGVFLEAAPRRCTPCSWRSRRRVSVPRTSRPCRRCRTPPRTWRSRSTASTRARPAAA